MCSRRSKSRLDGRVTIALIASYVLDWIVIIIAAVVAAILSNLTPNKRRFSLTNAEISFPHVEHEKISTLLLVLCSLVIPAVIICLVCILLVPGPTVSKSTPKTLIWRRKLWEWHTGWLGLALSLAAAFLITNGMKNLFGKPRPDLLCRCVPDVTNIAKYTIDGYSGAFESFHVVSAGICQQTDKGLLNDGFRSFPSGHSSFSAAGLVYLSLFLASKVAISVPFLAPSFYTRDESRNTAFPSRSETHEPKRLSISEPGQQPASGNEELQVSSGHDGAFTAARNQAAAPPIYLAVIAVLPFFVAIYIASTRYSDFRHHGFDILFGFLIGTVTAVFAFRLYHLPINQGAGWSWGPRSKDRSFWAGVGVGNYVGSNAKRETGSTRPRDVEAGNADGRTTNGSG